MCGLWAYFLIHENACTFSAEDFDANLASAMKCSSRGPDQTVEVRDENKRFHMVFHRLAIHDLTPLGSQPFDVVFEDGSRIRLMCNGEIYNYLQLVIEYDLNTKLLGKSDCEVICHLLHEHDWNVNEVCTQLVGEYAFVAHITDSKGIERIIVARDTYGVRPLYYCRTSYGHVFSSTLEACSMYGRKCEQFPPSSFCVMQGGIESFGKYDVTSMLSIPFFGDHSSKLFAYRYITDTLINAVKRRIYSERPIGFFLSGGLDSSLVVGIAVRILGLHPKSIYTYSIGFDAESPDIKYANIVADYLGTHHTNVILSPNSAKECVNKVIKHLGTYDTTTVRASVPQFLLAKYVSENTDIKVILNGDGSDEVSMGYLYTHYAPSDEEAIIDTYKLLNNIHFFDGLRVDRTLGAHGLEARLPFLDPHYVKAYTSLPVAWRRPGNGQMEKQFLRDAFGKLYPGVLPDSVLYRRKEAFSDGVTSTKQQPWFRNLNTDVSESMYYRQVFDKWFPGQASIMPYYWMPKWTAANDPSARCLQVYNHNHNHNEADFINDT